MSYCASGDGYVHLKNPNKDGQKVYEVLSEAFYATYWEDEGPEFINILHQYGKYNEDFVMETLQKVAPLIDRGGIDFMGEDGQLWRLAYNAEDSKWQERYGGPAYDKQDVYLMSYNLNGEEKKEVFLAEEEAKARCGYLATDSACSGITLEAVTLSI